MRRSRFSLWIGWSIALAFLLAGCTPVVDVQVTVGAPPSATPTAVHLPTATPQPTSSSIPVVQQQGQLVQVSVPESVEPTPLPAASVPPSRIVAPSIGLDSPVIVVGWVEGSDGSLSEWQTADFAAGFHQDSALPAVGGNTVLSGHHNINGKVFARVNELKPGDEVDLYAGEQIYRYQVEDSLILPEKNASDEQRRQNATWIAPTQDERLTLVTCWPADNNTHRVIVVARPVG